MYNQNHCCLSFSVQIAQKKPIKFDLVNTITYGIISVIAILLVLHDYYILEHRQLKLYINTHNHPLGHKHKNQKYIFPNKYLQVLQNDMLQTTKTLTLHISLVPKLFGQVFPHKCSMKKTVQEKLYFYFKFNLLTVTSFASGQ